MGTQHVMTTETFHSTSADMTEQIGTQIAQSLKAPVTLALVGDLGAGKTTFVKGLVKGLSRGEKVRVQSPTFALARTYDTSPRVHHIDLYRLHGSDVELYDLGIENLLDDEEAIVCIEWPDHKHNPLPDDVIWVRMTNSGNESRIIELTRPTQLL